VPGTPAAPAPVGPAARPATQVSASAVPSTLESPAEVRDAKPADASLRHDITTQDDAARVAAERDAAFAAAGVPVAMPAMNATAPLSPEPQESARRGAPATLMSPAVAPMPGALAHGDKPASPSLAPEDAVVDVGAPAHAFLPPGASPAYGSAADAGARRHPGVHGGAAHGGPGARRSMSTTTLVMVVVGGVAGILLLAAAVIGFFYVAERRKAEAAAAERALHPPTVPAAVTLEAPRTPPRFGGTKARLAVTSGGAMDAEAVHASLAGVLPRIDACFAAAELEPPNHESATYELDVQANGEVKKAEPAGAVPRAAKLDACVVQSLRAARLPKAARASVVKLTFSDPVDLR
jgi:hypothetical protein